MFKFNPDSLYLMREGLTFHTFKVNKTGEDASDITFAKVHSAQFSVLQSCSRTFWGEVESNLCDNLFGHVLDFLNENICLDKSWLDKEDCTTSYFCFTDSFFQYGVVVSSRCRCIFCPNMGLGITAFAI